jgi:hypothetical protein
MNIQEWQGYISIIKDVITTIAALTATVIAILGFRAWKKQLRGKTDYEMARRLLKAVYSVGDAVKVVRNSWMSIAEIGHSIREAGISIADNDREYDAKSNTAVYQIRWKELYQAISDLRLEVVEAKVSWGSQVGDKVDAILQRTSRLRAAVDEHLNQLRGVKTARTGEEIARIIL